MMSVWGERTGGGKCDGSERVHGDERSGGGKCDERDRIFCMVWDLALCEVHNILGSPSEKLCCGDHPWCPCQQQQQQQRFFVTDAMLHSYKG